MAFDREKLKALVHYVCRSCSDPSRLGKVKLHKIVWLSEGFCYVNQGAPIADEQFIRESYGPFAVHMNSVIDELVKDGSLNMRMVDYFGKTKAEFTARGEPRRDLFSDRQLRVVDQMIRTVCEDHTATSISEKTHDHIWEMAAEKEPLPLGVFLVHRLAPITDDDMSWAKAEVAKLS